MGGSFEWDGDWSDKSDLWTPSMKDYFKPRLTENDGSFWMNEEDFRRHYDSIGVLFMYSKSGDSWSQSRQQLKLNGDEMNLECLTFKVENNVSGFFTLLQRDDRILGAPD